MHRAFIAGNDYEVFETPERARQRRENDRAEQLAEHAYDPRIPGNGDRFGETHRKVAPPVMDAAELAEGPNLPHRDDKDISTLARDASRKTGYYRTGVDGFLTDVYMDKPSPIDRKAGSKRKRRHFASNGEEYYVTHGAGTAKPLTSSNKHLAYWRRPTEAEALRNLDNATPETRESSRWQVTLPRDMLVMLAQVIDIQDQRGKLAGDNRADMLREIAATVPPGEDVTLEWFTPAEVLSFTQGVPKRYKAGQFGEFLKDTATHVKLYK